MTWRRRAVGGWISADGKWTIRGPIMAKPMYWLYCGTSRYTPTGSYEGAVSFKSVVAAKRYVEKL